MLKKYYLLLLSFLIVGVCYSKPIKIKSGLWYTSFSLSEQDHLPVLLEFTREKKQSRFSIINGSERIFLEDIQFQADSVFIQFPAFASELRAKIHSKTSISGNWYNHAKKGNYYLPFWSKHNYASKYPIEEPKVKLSGRWEVTFDYNGEGEKAVGLFASEKKTSFGKEIQNRITGTFLTETGDYRFLEGATIGDSLYLSTFDGSHAFLFKAQLRSDTLWGEFLSGKHYKTTWIAVKNEQFELRHPDSLTIADKTVPLTFNLPTINGELYSYPNEATKGKVTLLQIMGTWCPNCLDESMYLKTLSEKHVKDLAILAITFETQKGLEAKMKKVATYQANLDLNYTFLIGGDACKTCAADIFPTLNHIMSFPTLIFIDKKGEVRKVHTGFNGPGTGKYYQQFVQSTNEFVEQLINE